MWSKLRLFLWTRGLFQIGVTLKLVNDAWQTVSDSHTGWMVRDYKCVSNRSTLHCWFESTICVQVAAKFNANRLGWWRPGSFSTSSNQWNLTSNEKLWFLKHLWDVNLIWLEVKWLICHLFEEPEPVILVVTAYILQFVDFGSSAGRWILTTASIRWIKHNVITWCHMGRAINLISFHFWSSRIYCI